MHVHDDPHNFKKQAIWHLTLVADATEQREYERSVPIADVPGEILAGFNYHPTSEEFCAAFTRDELDDLAELYRMQQLSKQAIDRVNAWGNVEAMLELPEWRRTMEFACDVLRRWGQDG